MENLLTASYWFNLRPEPLLGTFQNIFIGVIVFLIVATFVLAWLKKKNKDKFKQGLIENLFNFFLTNAVVGLIILFFNYEKVPFFSGRFWFLLWLIEGGIWIFFLGKQLKKIPELKKKKEE